MAESTNVFIVLAYTKVSANFFRFDSVLPGKVRDEDRIVVYPVMGGKGSIICENRRD